MRDRRFRRLKFRRQHPLGAFIADFYCPDHRLVVEVDGGVHTAPAARAHDETRDAWLTDRGIRTIRVSSSTVLQDVQNALQLIADAIDQARIFPSPAERERGPGGEGRGDSA